MKNRPNAGDRRLRFETMEDRRLMAGLAASLSGGILTINGTAGSDFVNFRQAGGWLAIDGVHNAWRTGDVNAIVLNLSAGDDAVRLNGLTEDLVVNAGGGTETIQFANGQETSFGASGGMMLVWNGNYARFGAAVVYDQRSPDPASETHAVGAVPSSLPPATGISSKYSGGILTIIGNESANFINIRQINGFLAVDGLSGYWETKLVNRIDVQLKGGDDVLYINGCTETLNVTANSGTKQVRFANGTTISYNGAGNTLAVTGGNYAKLNNQVVYDTRPNQPPAPPPPPPAPTTNWFGVNVVDAALRSLGSNLYADNVISRSDILSLFESAKDGGVVDAVELTDLRAIAANTSLFGGKEHLWKLASYVVTNQVANAYYAGAGLGNFVAGSSSAQLTNLVNKWFRGLDRPAASGAYRQFAGQLFVNGATLTDIKQGSVGDCYFVMSLAEVAQHNPTLINNMFIANGDGTYTVKFYTNGQPYYVTVDSYLPTNASGQAIYANYGMAYNNAGNELWTALAEKAYVQLNQFGLIRAGLSGSGQNSYSAISGGYICAALNHITGQSTVNFTAVSAASFQTFVSAYNAGKLIGFASKTTTPAGSGVVASHAYSVVSYSAASQQVTLFNPWGVQHGLLTLTWSQIQASFSYFDRTA